MSAYIINLLIVFAIFLVTRAIKDKEKGKKIFLYLSFLELFLFLALRGLDVGADLRAYFNLYDNCNLYSLTDVFKFRYEKGYIFYTYVIANFINNKQWFLVITAFISLIGPLFAIKRYSKNYYLSVFVYITFQFYVYNFYILRQVMALSIVLLSIKFIEERKFIKFLLLVILATLFHTSAILFIAVYFISKIKINNKILVLLYGAVIGIVLFGDSIIKYILGFIQNYAETGNNGGIPYFIVLFIVFLIATLVKNKFFTDKNDIMWYNILVIAILIQTLTLKLSILSRLNIYYTISIIMVLPNLLECFKDKRIKNIGEIAIVLMLTLYFINALNDTNIYRNYHFFGD